MYFCLENKYIYSLLVCQQSVFKALPVEYELRWTVCIMSVDGCAFVSSNHCFSLWTVTYSKIFIGSSLNLSLKYNDLDLWITTYWTTSIGYFVWLHTIFIIRTIEMCIDSLNFNITFQSLIWFWGITGGKSVLVIVYLFFF